MKQIVTLLYRNNPASIEEAKDDLEQFLEVNGLRAIRNLYSTECNKNGKGIHHHIYTEFRDANKLTWDKGELRNSPCIRYEAAKRYITKSQL